MQRSGESGRKRPREVPSSKEMLPHQKKMAVALTECPGSQGCATHSEASFQPLKLSREAGLVLAPVSRQDTETQRGTCLAQDVVG